MSKVDAQRAMREAKYARLRASGPTRREAAAQAAPEAAEPATALVDEVPATKAPATKAKKTRAAKSTTPDGTGDAGEALLPVEPGEASDGAPAEASAEGPLCGHKSMNGRTCTREAGHAEKSHRYG